MKKHYLVCGGAGFIGINLCRHFIKLGHKVTVIDNLYCGNADNLPKTIKFIQSDIKDIQCSMLDSKIDGIFNLACPASPKNYQKDPFFTINTCVQGVLKLLQIAQTYKIPILQASTSEVYGMALESPQKEEYYGNVNCTGIRACYDEGKRIAETLCFDHYRQYGTKIRVVRIFNTYGPYMDENDGRVISNFIIQALSKKPITIYGDGTQTRSFCYIDDLIDGLIKMIESDYIGPINLGNPDERSINNIVEHLSKLIQNDIKIVYKPLPQNDPLHRCPDISKAKKILKWKPNISFEEGLKRVIEYYNLKS